MTFNADITEFFKKETGGPPPAVSKKYRVPPKGGKLNIAPQDLVNFQKLYPVKSKAGGFNVGNGELATFYLFNFENPRQPKTRAQENRGGSDADLIIDKKNVEIKAYPYKTGGADKKVGLGRFGQYYAFREMISTMLHEMVHVWQYVTGRMVQNWVHEVRFNRVDYSSEMPYNERPWEIEAHDKEKELWEAYDREYAKRNREGMYGYMR